MTSETQPLLGNGSAPRKPFYRPRQLWIIPFFFIAAVVRGMTLAPRVEVYTNLACQRVQWDNSTIPYPSDSDSDDNYTARTPSDFMSFNAHVYALSNFEESTIPYIVASLPIPVSHVHHHHNATLSSSQLPAPPPPPPSEYSCTDDPLVQAGAAKIQAIFTTTMGFLSVLTSGWWGSFSERYGRLRVLAIATFGLFLTDLTFVLISHPSLPFLSSLSPIPSPSTTSPTSLTWHYTAKTLLILSPALEGLLGGWSVLQSGSTAYISDCTNEGSKSHVFSRLVGVMFLGVSVGPAVGGWLMKHPFPFVQGQGGMGMGMGMGGGGGGTTTVCMVAAIFSAINFLCVVFVFPESLSVEERGVAVVGYRKRNSVTVVPIGGGDVPPPPRGLNWIISRFIKPFISPLSIFLPVHIPPHPNQRNRNRGGTKKRKDWSLTILAIATFLFLLSTGIYQLKYLYIGHIYKWSTERLSYFITMIAGARAVYMIFLFPMIISTFKPKPPTLDSSSSPPAIMSTPGSGLPQNAISPQKQKQKQQQDIQLLAKEIHFDLILAKCGLFIDALSNVFICATPLPLTFPSHRISAATTTHNNHNHHKLSETLNIELQPHSEGLFIFSTMIASLGSGTFPVFQSLALCLVKARRVRGGGVQGEGNENSEEGNGESEGEKGETTTTGQLFGALAVLQALGQMIVGPALFGLIYSTTVASYPKAMFVVCGAILGFTCFLVVVGIRSPIEEDRVSISGFSGDEEEGDAGDERGGRGRGRGRSTDVRDLNGGAFGNVYDRTGEVN